MQETVRVRGMTWERGHRLDSNSGEGKPHGVQPKALGHLRADGFRFSPLLWCW